MIFGQLECVSTYDGDNQTDHVGARIRLCVHLEGVGEGVGADETAHETIVVADEEEAETGEEGHAVEKGIVLEANHGGGDGLG
jgi:hypothetical protein